MISLFIIGIIVGFCIGRYCAAKGYEQGRIDVRREDSAAKQYREANDAQWERLVDSARRNQAELERLRQAEPARIKEMNDRAFAEREEFMRTMKNLGLEPTPVNK